MAHKIVGNSFHIYPTVTECMWSPGDPSFGVDRFYPSDVLDFRINTDNTYTFNVLKDTFGYHKVSARMIEGFKITDSVRIFSRSTYLSSITVSKDSPLQLSPTFNENIFDYTVRVANYDDIIFFDAIPKHVTTKVVPEYFGEDYVWHKFTSETPLDEWVRLLRFTTESELSQNSSIFDETKMYTINILGRESEDATAKDINIAESFEGGVAIPLQLYQEDEYYSTLRSSQAHGFDPEVFHYHVDVPAHHSHARFQITPSHRSAKKTKVQTVMLDTINDSHDVLLRVTAESGHYKDYIVTVHKGHDRSTHLSCLTVDESAIPLQEDVLKYKFTVQPEVSRIHIQAEPAITSSRVSGTGWFNLNCGTQQIPITVLSVKGTKRIYRLDMTREDTPEPPATGIEEVSSESTISYYY